jgi:hypothetical protein
MASEAAVQGCAGAVSSFLSTAAERQVGYQQALGTSLRIAAERG